MRIALSFTLISLAACGGSGNDSVDAPPKDIGFSNPVAPLMANREISEDNWEEIGPADLACLGTPAADPPTTVAVALSTVVRDFQSDNLVPNSNITVFRGQNLTDVFDTKTSDGTAAVTIDIPTGVTRFGYKMTSDNALDTLLLNQKVEPSNPTQTEASIKSVSKTTAQTMPALIGVSRTPGTGVLAGAMYDCADRQISNFIATVSSTSGTVTHLPGADAYYFDPTTPLPVRHTVRGSASSNGLFMVIELPVAPTAYVQVWGFPTDADLASGELKLIAELQAPVIADTVITGSYEPLRTGN
jgi:hypothetical protein